MANPRTRQELKDYCLRALGAPVIEINVDDQQVEDRIDEALRYFVDWNSYASEKRYYKYQVTDQDKTNGYISTDSIGLDGSNIISISRVFQVGFNLQMNNVFNVRYQMALNDFYGLRTGQSNLNFFVSTMQYVEMLQQLLDPEKQTELLKRAKAEDWTITTLMEKVRGEPLPKNNIEQVSVPKGMSVSEANAVLHQANNCTSLCDECPFRKDK